MSCQEVDCLIPRIKGKKYVIKCICDITYCFQVIVYHFIYLYVDTCLRTVLIAIWFVVYKHSKNTICVWILITGLRKKEFSQKKKIQNKI